jgi:hypothetical protein
MNAENSGPEGKTAAPVASGANVVQRGGSIRNATQLGFYLAVLAITLAVVWTIQNYHPPYFAAQSDKPTQWQQIGVQIAADTSRLLTTLATGLLAATGLFFKDGLSGGEKGPRHVWSAFVCAISAGASLFFGYLLHLNLLWMMSHQTFDASSALFQFPSECQFYLLLAAAFFLADFVLNNSRGYIE